MIGMKSGHIINQPDYAIAGYEQLFLQILAQADEDE